MAAAAAAAAMAMDGERIEAATLDIEVPPNALQVLRP